ncbi:MAG: DNA-directed RNA polymerase subunit alpha C-terminal domain-containing protein [Patescibacteria group bacterium]
MITLRKTVSLSLDINDLNEAVILFLKDKGFEPFDKVTIEDLQKIIDGGQLVLNAHEVNDQAGEKHFEEYDPEKINIIFPDEFIARLGGYSQGLEMFLCNVSDEGVQKMLNKTYRLQSTIERRVLAFYHKLYDDTNKEFINVAFNESDPDLRYNSAIHIFTEELHANFRGVLFENKLEAKLSLSRAELLEKNIIDLYISNRSTTSLLRVDITSVEKMLNWYENKDPKNIRNLGPKSFKEIQDFIKLYKLHSEFSVIS